MSTVNFLPIRGTKAQIDAEPIVDGQMLFSTDQVEYNKIYADVGEERVQIGGTNEIDDTLSTSSTNAIQNKVVTENFNNLNESLGNIVLKTYTHTSNGSEWYQNQTTNIALDGYRILGLDGYYTGYADLSVYRCIISGNNLVTGFVKLDKSIPPTSYSLDVRIRYQKI